MSLSGHWGGIHIALTVRQMLRTFYWTHPSNPLFEAAPSVVLQLPGKGRDLVSGHRGSQPGSTACCDTQAPVPPFLHCVHKAPRCYQPCFSTLHVGTRLQPPPSSAYTTVPVAVPGHLSLALSSRTSTVLQVSA